MRHPDGRAVLVAGSTGSGKTAWTRDQVGGASRLLVWDPLGEWRRELRLTPITLRELARVARAHLAMGAADGRFAVSAPIAREHFAAFASLAWVWLRAAPGCLVVEELADVTSPGKAPSAWGDIVRKGRHYGASVYAITQRPAESDKTIVGNAAAIHTGMLSFPSDRTYLANCLDVPVSEIAGLKPLQWIERDMRTRELRRGTIKFARAKR